MNSDNTVSKISYQGLKASSDNLNKMRMELNEILANVETAMKRVNTEEVWKSAAAENMLNKFIALKEKTYETFDVAIDSYSKFLNSTAESYAAADAAIKAKQDELLQ